VSSNQQLLLGEGAGSAPAVYVEDVFSTYLYTGNGSTQTITNNIDLSTKGGMVWFKCRSNPTNHLIFDTVRGRASAISPTTTAGAGASSASNEDLVSFNATGFSLGIPANYDLNTSSRTYVSWAFREQPKFFDVVTYTGTGATQHDVAHNLGSVPGFIIVKDTSQTSSWRVAARKSDGTYCGLSLNNTNAASPASVTAANAGIFSTYVDFGNTGFSGQIASVNVIGATYVAYLFAHNAGGFGLAGTDNVISCGSFSGGGATVNLGWEPQWILAKRTDTTGNWYIDDNMRGWPAAPENDNPLLANTADAEPTGYAGFANITSTGFTNNFNGDYIYIAIRRGPMKVPTVGTSVFSPIAKTGDASTTTITNVGFPADLFMFKWTALAYGWKQQDRLRGFVQKLTSDATTAESNSGTYTFGTVNNTGYTYGANASTSGELNGSGVTSSVLAFGRAPGFMDVVCYAGTGSNLTVAHNLTVAPQLIIIKNRTHGWSWNVGYNFGVSSYDFLTLENNDPGTGNAYSSHYTAAPTATQFFLATNVRVNQSSANFVAYLFSTLAGVSKVGTYTGTGTTQVINCGFTSGARFVMIKRTDNVGDWYVWDSARGIIAGNDPYLLLNSTAAEVTSTDYIDTAATGFEISSTAPGAVNFSGGSYIFLAIA
jgi:hypothetical protein